MRSKEYPLLFEDCVIKGDMLYFFSMNFNALYSYNFVFGKLTFIDRIPDEKYFQGRLIGNVLLYDSKLVLVPMRTTTSKVWLYDLNGNFWSSISIDTKNIKPPYEKIAYATIYEEHLILVGCYYGGIININLNTQEIVYCDKVFDDDLKIHSLFDCERIDDELYIPSPETNKVLKFNMKSNEGKWLSVGDENCSYSGLIWTGSNFWLAPYKGTDIVKWNGDEIYEQFKIPDYYGNKENYLFRGIGKILNKIYIVGLQNIQAFAFEEDNCYNYEVVPNTYVMYKGNKTDDYIVQDYLGKVEMRWNGKLYKFLLTLQPDEILAKANGNDIRANMFEENNNLDLELFIKMI